MADVDSTNDQSIAAKYLPHTLGILLGVPAFRALRNQNINQPMHPAVAQTMGWKRSLSHPQAIAQQRELDDHMMRNFEHYDRLDPIKAADEIHRKYGWQYGPVMGLSKEIHTDPSIQVGPEGQYNHPAGDVLGTLGVNRRITYSNPETLKKMDPGEPDMSTLGLFRSYSSGARPKIFLSNDFNMNPYLFKDKYDQWQSPLKAAITAHETQHGAQNSADYFSQYNSRIPWAERPHEWEARGVENRALEPKLYNQPFLDTSGQMDLNALRNELFNPR